MNLTKYKNLFSVKGPKSLYIYSVIIGIISGLGAFLFAFGLAKAEFYILGGVAGLELNHPPGEIHFSHPTKLNFNPYIFLLLPPLGGLITGLITFIFCKEAEGTGTDAMIRAFHQEEGKMNTRVPFFKSIATIVTLSTGGSAGKEGPTAQIGAGFGVIIANLLGVGARARRTFLLAGTAAGLGAVFRAPLGGAMTAVEVIYQEDIESDSLVPCIISSVTAYLFFASIAGEGTIFQVENLYLKDYKELFFYFLLGLLCFAVGFVFVKTFHFIGEFFKKIPIHPIFKPALGGIPVGILGFFFPEIIGAGFGLLQDSISGKSILPNHSLINIAFFFLLIAFLKILSTSLTIGSGGSGGVFAPAMFIGGMLGGFVGTLSKVFFPELNFSISAFILVGMSSFFAGVARAPIGGMIMVCDMIGSYALLPPLMIVSMIAFILSHRWSIYKGQVHNRFESPAHDWDMNRDIMERIPIKKYFSDFRKYAIIKKNMLLSDAEEYGLKIQASDFIVTDEENSYLGVTSLRRFRLGEENRDLVRNIVTVEDVSFKIPSINPNSSIGDALKIILSHDIDKVAVENENKLIGYLRYIDLLNAYHTELRKFSRNSI